MENRSIANIGARQPQAGGGIEHSDRCQTFQLTDIVRVGQQLRMFVCRRQHPILNQEFDVRQTTRVLLDVELSRFGARQLATHAQAHLCDVGAQSIAIDRGA